MEPRDVKLIDAARLQFDAVSEKARVLIYRKVLEHFQRHPDSPWSGAPLRDLEQTIRQFYADLGVKYDKAFRETLPPTMQKFYDRAVQEMRTAGVRKAILGKPDSGRVKYFMDSAFEQVAMKTQNMTFQHIKALRTITADVTRQMSVTGATRREVSKALLDRAMEIPGFEFIDKAGNKWPLKSYFNTLARTELMTAARASYDDKITQEGCDVVMLDFSGNCCESCAKWEGKLFSLTGATPGLPTKSDLEADGVFHPNCTHSYSVVPDYIRERDYNPDGTQKSREPESGNAPLFRGNYSRDNEKKFDGEFTENGRVFDDAMKRAGVPREIRDELNWNHTPDMQRLCGGNPNVSMVARISGVKPGTRNMGLTGDKECSRCTATHEYGHFVANSVFDITRKFDVSEFEAAAAADWRHVSTQEWIKPFRNLCENQNAKIALQEKWANDLFGKSFSELSYVEQWKLIADADILGSISVGDYGFGHLMETYVADFFREAFANMYLARKYHWTDICEKYPNIMKYLEEKIK